MKDHTIFWYDGLYYLASIYLTNDSYDETYETKFAYASSADLCTWTDLGGILEERTPGSWDEWRIWAPFVYEEGGTYYMFYTGVTRSFAQSTMLATSTDPSNPDSWVRHGVVFQPAHPGAIWPGFNYWSDCRDPTVVKSGELYYLYYTGKDTSGGIIGVATASSLNGPWTDQGAVANSTTGSMPESPTLSSHGSLHYLFYNDASVAGDGEVFRYGPTVVGPWSEQHPFRPGWAHEVWLGQDANFYTSYVWKGGVAIRPLTWDDFYDPPHPFVGLTPHHYFLPSVHK